MNALYQHRDEDEIDRQPFDWRFTALWFVASAAWVALIGVFCWIAIKLAPALAALIERLGR